MVQSLSVRPDLARRVLVPEATAPRCRGRRGIQCLAIISRTFGNIPVAILVAIDAVARAVRPTDQVAGNGSGRAPHNGACKPIVVIRHCGSDECAGRSARLRGPIARQRLACCRDRDCREKKDNLPHFELLFLVIFLNDSRPGKVPAPYALSGTALLNERLTADTGCGAAAGTSRILKQQGPSMKG
jgi:hypothetical protein